MAGPDTISFVRTEKYTALLAEEVEQMRRDRHFTDFTITSNGKSFTCHRLMVAAHSPYLKEILTSDIVEAAKYSITLDHIQPKVVEVILDYIYAGQISFDTDNLKNMIRACDYLRMKVLKEMCVGEAPAILNITNVISWLRLGNELDLTDLNVHCTTIMVAGFTEISHQPDFLTLTYEELQHYIKEVLRSDVERDDLLRCTMRWVSHNTERRLTHLENLFQLVELNKCSLSALLDVLDTYVSVFAADMKVHKLLTQAMKQIGGPPVESPPPPPTPPHGEEDGKELCATVAVQQRAQNTKPKKRTTTKPQQSRPTAQFDRMLLIVGGQVTVGADFCKEVSRVCWKLNKSKQFVELCKIPYDDLKIGHSVCKTPQGFAITGGKGSDLFIMFIAATKSWMRLPKMLLKRSDHASICIKGVIYVFGGFTYDDNGHYDESDSVDCFSMESGRWEHGPDLTTLVEYPSVAALHDHVFLLDPTNGQLLRLDVERKEWTELAPPPDDLQNYYYKLSMIAVGDKLCVAGGRTSAWYNPDTDTWSVRQQPSEWHDRGALVHYDDAVLLLGGRWDFGGSDTIEEYRMEDDSWSDSTLQMPASLREHHALVLDMADDE